MGRKRKSKKPKSTDSNVNEKAKSTDSNVNEKAKSTDSNVNEKAKSTDSNANEKKAVTETSKYRLSLKDLQEKIPPEYYSSKPFEHVIITWTVSNFAYNHDRQFSLRSSRLPLTAAEPSLWYLGLTRQKDYTYDNNNKLSIVLVGMCTNPLQNITYEGRVGYIYFHDENVKWLGHCRPRTRQRYFDFSCVANILSQTFCSLKIVCELYVYKYSEPEPFVYLNAALTMKIPKHNVLGERKIYVTIELPDGNAYKIDKDICYQSPVLKREIINSKNNTITLKFDPIATVQCLAFLHLKRVDYLVDNLISFELYELAKSLEIQELENLLSPTKIHIDSESGGENFTFLWETKENESIESYIGNTKSINGMTWWIILEETKICFYVNVDFENYNPEFVLHFELSAFDNDGNEFTIFQESLVDMKKGDSGLEYEICKNPAVEHKRIMFRCCNSNMRFTNTITKFFIHGVTQTTRSLEESMIDLSIRDDSNIVIIAGNKKFKVHKEILESRSDSFLKLLSDENKSEVTVPDVPADLMELILHFIYNGKLNTRDWGTVRRLYKKRDQFRVEFLPIVCLQFFSVDYAIDDAIDDAIISETC